MDRTPREPGSSDILYLLDRLEELLGEGTGLPFTRRRLIDDEEWLSLIEQIRLSLPQEIRQARRMNTEREAIIDEAQARALQIIRSAELEAEERVQEHHVTRRAESRGEEIIGQADRRAAQMRREADEYAFAVLTDLERRMDSLMASLRGGLLDLEARQERRPEIEPEPETGWTRGDEEA